MQRLIRLIAIGLPLVMPVAATASPDEMALGKAQGYPVAPTMRQSRQEPYIVGSFSAMDTLGPYCEMKPAAVPLPLLKASTDIQISYRFRGATYSLDDYMQRQRVTGLLVLHDGQIVAERYGYDRTADMRMLSNSMSKTLTALGLMKALEEGAIHSLDDKASAYVPELAGSLLGETKLVDLMRMASGAKFVEDYSPRDDRAKFNRIALQDGYIAAAKSITERSVPEGTAFNYFGAQTQTLALVLRAATHKPICDYIDKKIWQPMGAEAAATWLVNGHDTVEIAQGGLNATVRDYARFGLLMANDGMALGHQVVSVDHLLDMTDATHQPPEFRPGQMHWHDSTYAGYGLQVWLWPGSHRRFVLLGVYGQAIFVDPELKLVMVQTAVGKDAAGDASSTHLGAERDALFRGIVAHYGKW